MAAAAEYCVLNYCELLRGKKCTSDVRRVWHSLYGWARERMFPPKFRGRRRDLRFVNLSRERSRCRTMILYNNVICLIFRLYKNHTVRLSVRRNLENYWTDLRQISHMYSSTLWGSVYGIVFRPARYRVVAAAGILLVSAQENQLFFCFYTR